MLNLSDNSLTGPLPAEWSCNLTVLNLPTTAWGPLPAEWGLTWRCNSLSGAPVEWLAYIRVLNLSDNNPAARAVGPPEQPRGAGPLR